MNGLSIFARKRLICVSTTLVFGSKWKSQTRSSSMVARHHPALVAHQNLEQREFARLQVDAH